MLSPSSPVGTDSLGGGSQHMSSKLASICGVGEGAIPGGYVGLEDRLVPVIRSLQVINLIILQKNQTILE